MIIFKLKKKQPGVSPLSKKYNFWKSHGIVSLSVLETVVVFQITTLELAKLQRIVKKGKKLKFGTKS